MRNHQKGRGPITGTLKSPLQGPEPRNSHRAPLRWPTVTGRGRCRGDYARREKVALFNGRWVRRFEGFAGQAERRLQILESATSLSDLAGVPSNRLEAFLINETRTLTADTALRLARYFGTTPEFWLNLQMAYELRRAQQNVGSHIAREVVPRAATG
jgi:antitoxin HigA-1